MKTNSISKIAVIESDLPEEFEKLFNSKMDELSMSSNVSYEFFNTNVLYRAIIFYTETTHEFNSILDEFHAEGVYYHCRNCPFLEDPKDKRVKYCMCKYSETGTTHKDKEACAVFYKKLKNGSVTPIPDYCR